MLDWSDKNSCHNNLSKSRKASRPAAGRENALSAPVRWYKNDLRERSLVIVLRIFPKKKELFS